MVLNEQIITSYLCHNLQLAEGGQYFIEVELWELLDPVIILSMLTSSVIYVNECGVLEWKQMEGFK
jgi:hypothetical protein